MNCHVIMDTYMDDDVDTTSAHLWTGQNLRWANFWPNFSYFRSSFSAILASRFQLLFSPNSSPIFNALLSPLLNHIQPIYTAQFRTYDPYTQPMYTAYTTNNCSSTSNKKYYVFIQHHITWIFIQHQIQHLAVLDIHQHTTVPDIHQNKELFTCMVRKMHLSCMASFFFCMAPKRFFLPSMVFRPFLSTMLSQG